MITSCSSENTEEPVAVDATVPSQSVFVTRSEYTGNLGGLDGADQLCQSAAESADLRGDWVAWLSDDTTDAFDRVTSGGPWRDLRGRTVFANRSALMTSPLIPIRVQENGELTSFPLEDIWTGTSSGGRGSGDHCNNWTSGELIDQGGRGLSNEEGWTSGFNNACSATARLYCFEI